MNRWGSDVARCLALLACAGAICGCDKPETDVVFVNGLPSFGAASPVIYRARWHAVTVTDAILPGAESAPQPSVPASPIRAYALVAPAWDPGGPAPTSLVVLASRGGYGLDLDSTVRILVDDSSFIGDCASGERLSQAEADYVTRLVFPSEFAGLSYDAANCRTFVAGDAGP